MTRVAIVLGHAEILINVMKIAMSIKQNTKKKPMFVILQFIWKNFIWKNKITGKFSHSRKFSHPKSTSLILLMNFNLGACIYGVTPPITRIME
jgi:hypothetical protein